VALTLVVTFTSADTYWSQKIFRYCRLTTFEAEIPAARAVARVNGRLPSKGPTDCVGTNTPLTMRRRRIFERAHENLWIAEVAKLRLWMAAAHGLLQRHVAITIQTLIPPSLANLS
jgi:hypothetical protein